MKLVIEFLPFRILNTWVEKGAECLLGANITALSQVSWVTILYGEKSQVLDVVLVLISSNPTAD